MDREQAKVITEYDHLISILIGLLLPPIGRTVKSWSLRRAAGKDQLELHNSEERANRGDEDILSCVVKFIVLTSPFSPCCLCVLASSQGPEAGEKWFHGALHGPSLQSTDRPVDVVNQPKTCDGETGCASKKC